LACSVCQINESLLFLISEGHNNLICHQGSHLALSPRDQDRCAPKFFINCLLSVSMVIS
jgi:hypothetical protein